MEEIRPGSEVTLHFTLTLEDGTEALTTLGEEPLRCRLGDDTLRAGMEMALYGLRAGDEQTITLTPEQGWGQRNEGLIQNLPRNNFAEEMTLEPGQIVAFELADGEETSGIVLALDAHQVEVDFNHPLAGHHVEFWVRVLQVDNS